MQGEGERKREFKRGQNMKIEVRRQRDKNIFRKEDEKIGDEALYI